MLFLSTFINKIDKKGRVSVPSSFRALLMEKSFPGIIAYQSISNECIESCSIERIQRLSESIDDMDPYSDERDYLSTALFGLSEELKIDNDGRVILSDALIDHAQIKDEVTFVGLGEKFQIWEPLKFESYLQQAQKKVKFFMNHAVLNANLPSVLFP